MHRLTVFISFWILLLLAFLSLALAVVLLNVLLSTKTSHLGAVIGDGKRVDNSKKKPDSHHWVDGRSQQYYALEAEEGTNVKVSDQSIAVVVALATEPRSGNGFLDSAAVLAHSVHVYIDGTGEHGLVRLIALCGPGTAGWSKQTAMKVERAGWEAVPVDLPVRRHETEKIPYHEPFAKSGCCGESELVKLHAFGLVDYSRVLLLEVESLLLQSLDGLLNENTDAIWTDKYLDGSYANNGFFVIRPSDVVYSRMVALVRKGYFQGASGRGGVKISRCSEGEIIPRLVPYYYQKIHHKPLYPGAAKWRLANACVYNNLYQELPCGNGNTTMRSTNIDQIKVVHFTACCKKKFLDSCGESTECEPLCSAWWSARNSLEAVHGIKISVRCKERKKYVPLKLWKLLNWKSDKSGYTSQGHRTNFQTVTRTKAFHHFRKGILTYKRFGGRLNNQIFQFVAALQHAVVLNRTLVVPPETNAVEWTAMFDVQLKVWDLSHLNAAYSIDWTSAVRDPVNVPDRCTLTSKDQKEFLSAGLDVWKQWEDKCPDAIDIGGQGGLLFCRQQHRFCGNASVEKVAFDIVRKLRLSQNLINVLPSAHPEYFTKGYSALAIHSRRAGEGSYSMDICTKGNRRTCQQHVNKKLWNTYCDDRTMQGNCAVWTNLDYQIKSETVRKLGGNEVYRFVLASDGTHDWSTDYKGQYLIANNTKYLLMLEMDATMSRPLLRRNVQSKYATELANIGFPRFIQELDRLTSTLLDLFSLVEPVYLLGAFYSTLSLNACLLRGVERIYNSNMCWMLMHPETDEAIPTSTSIYPI